MYTFFMKIHEVSKKTGMKKRTIYFYIKEELLSPPVNGANGYYDFREKDVQSLLLIGELRNAGFPISTIRSIMKEPATASYYLSNYVSAIQKQKEHLEKTIESIRYVIEKLPLQITLDSLYETMQKARIPAAIDKEDMYVSRDSSLLNRYLWSPFIPDDITNDYHEFLWSKINRLVAESSNEDYETLSRYLNSLRPKEIELLYRGRGLHLAFVVSLDDAGCHTYVKTLKTCIEENLKNERIVRQWKQNYRSFYLPTMRIYDSSAEQGIIAQISPFFAKYRENIHKICRYLYDDLQEEPDGLPERMNQRLGDCIDLDGCHHAALEAFGVLQSGL